MPPQDPFQGREKILSWLLSPGQGEDLPETAYHEGERFEEKRVQARLPMLLT